MTSDVEDPGPTPDDSGAEEAPTTRQGRDGVRFVERRGKRHEDWKFPIKIDDSPEWKLPGGAETAEPGPPQDS
jgi:hypothetical protein